MNLAIAAALGLLLGLFSLVGDGARLTVVVGLANAASPWLVTAFAAGAVARHPRRGAVAGALALAIAVVVYYVGLLARDSAPADIGITTLAWIGVAVLAGPAFGAAGGAWGDGREPIAVGILAGALLAEAAYRFILLEAWDGIDLARTSMQVAIVDLLAAALAPVLLLGRDRWPIAYGMALVVAPIGLALVALVTWAIQELRF